MQPDPRDAQQMSMALWVGPPLPAVPLRAAMPLRAGVGRRTLGWFADFLIVLVPGLLLIGFEVRSVVQGLPAYIGDVAAEVGVPRLVGLITGGGAANAGIGAAVAGSWLGLVWPLVLALLAVPLLQFLYHLSLLAWQGRTIGKMIAGTRVSPAGTDASARFAARRAVAATLVETGPVGLGLALVVYGELTTGALALSGAVVVWWVNVLPVFGPRHRTLVDRVSGTVVVRRARFEQVAALTRRTSDAAVVLGRRGTVAVAGTGRRTADAAAVAVRMSADAAAAAARTSADAAVSATARTADAAAVAARMSADAAVVAAQVAGEAAAAARRRSAEHLPAAARRTTDAAAAAARVTAAAAADAAAVASQAARHGAGKVIQTAPVQQALNSRVGQQSQALGAAGAQRARRLGGRTAGLARTVGDRTQQLWQDRQAARTEQQHQQREAAGAEQPALPATSPDLTSASQYLPPQPEPLRHPLP